MNTRVLIVGITVTTDIHKHGIDVYRLTSLDGCHNRSHFFQSLDAHGDDQSVDIPDEIVFDMIGMKKKPLIAAFQPVSSQGEHP